MKLQRRLLSQPPCTLSAPVTPIAVDTEPQAEMAVSMDHALRRAWGHYLDPMGWDYFVTLTSSRALSYDQAKRQFASFIRRLERDSYNYVSWFRIRDGDGSTHHSHFHALLGDIPHLTSRAVEQAWRLGHTRVLRYERGRGASYYIASHITNFAAEHDISSYLPGTHLSSPHRRRRR